MGRSSVLWQELAVAEPERAGVMLDGVAAQAVGDGEQLAARLRGIFLARPGLAGTGRGGCHCEQRRHHSA